MHRWAGLTGQVSFTAAVIWDQFPLPPIAFSDANVVGLPDLKAVVECLEQRENDKQDGACQLHGEKGASEGRSASKYLKYLPPISSFLALEMRFWS